MKIRRLRKEDAKKVSNLIRKCLREVNIKDYPKKVIINICNVFTPSRIIKNLKDRVIFVAVEKEKILGTASLKENTVFTVFVNPKAHGKGIGSKLMNEVEKLAKKKGHKIIKVPSGLSSVTFYKKRGYKKIKIIHSEKHGDTVEMTKQL